ncbi:MAG TPA: DNA alkylation repair protein [Vicinamibacterales bacterium]|nr:DNA alkylation repair protein [Vicinamibacterales bacterium]
MPAVKDVLKQLAQKSTPHDLANLKRFGIAASKPMGVSMKNIQVVAREVGRDHALAEALWKTGRYEARMLAALVDHPSQVTRAQMDRWCRDFDNWGICDTVCFKLFDQTPHAWSRVPKWANERGEFQKRAGFALLASLAGHDKSATDARFIAALRLIEAGAEDDRDLVKKGVSWALRRIGTRNKKLLAASLIVARRLAASDIPSARWIGKDAVRDLTRPR